ncbi:hypothetical protein [Streptomyces acidiscabies]|uniref:Uncharacterized protein n=1 Tax=Streptomyces acidiscabies TaxID=42234 RepID=A0ABU4LVU8_9ACTN|nr:hypothetical protein [Streptomyces acidiscabies]MDX3019865.1 hypothetical protein [Streptomyces acidiscabies]
MNTFTVTSPDPSFSGESAGVVFKDGVGRVDDSTKAGRAAIEYFRRRGYPLTPEGTDGEPEEVQEDGVQTQDDTPPPPPFEPAKHDVPEVLAYLDTITDETEIARVLEAEKVGKARKTILEV